MSIHHYSPDMKCTEHTYIDLLSGLGLQMAPLLSFRPHLAAHNARRVASFILGNVKNRHDGPFFALFLHKPTLQVLGIHHFLVCR